jgi:hypothetical protein
MIRWNLDQEECLPIMDFTIRFIQTHIKTRNLMAMLFNYVLLGF